ncbi:MAG: hypothetical protein ACI4TG_02355 [Ruminococcus sp.]
MDTKRKYYSMEEAMQEETLRKQLQNAQRKQAKQERKERTIAIGMVIVILLLCLPLLLYYIKEKAEKLIRFCHILKEDPVFIIGTIAVLIPVTWVLYVLIRKVRKKQPAHLLELCIVLAGCFIMIGYIILQEIMKSF